MNDKTPQALGEKVEALRAEIVELDALEAPTEEQAARFDAALVEFDAAKADFDKANERAAKVEAVRAAAVNPVNRERAFEVPNVVVRNDPFDGIENLRYMRPEEQRDRALAALEVAGGRRANADHVAEVARKIEDIDGVAAYALVHASPAYRSAFEEYMRSKGRPAYTAEEAFAVRASMALGSTTGGAALPTLLDPTLIHTGTATKNPIRRIARVVTGTQNVWHGVSVGNVAVYYKGEGSAMTDGSPTFAAPSVTASNLTAYVTGSYEIFEDSNLLSQLPGLISEAFDYKEGTAFISGSGSDAPKGIITAISATAGSTVTATTRGAFTTASAVDVFALLNALPSRYEDSSTWVANKQTFNTIKQMSTGSQGSYFWSDFNAGVGAPLLGSPIVQASDMATATTSGTALIVLGDFSQYVVYDRIGTSVEYVQNVVDGSGLPTGQRGLIAHKRTGADVTDLGAFRFLKT